MSSQVAHLEPWLDKKALAAHLRCSERWIEYRAREGMPAWKIAGRIKFRPSEVEAWLTEQGHMERGPMSYARRVDEAAPAVREHPGARHGRSGSHAR